MIWKNKPSSEKKEITSTEKGRVNDTRSSLFLLRVFRYLRVTNEGTVKIRTRNNWERITNVAQWGFINRKKGLEPGGNLKVRRGITAFRASHGTDAESRERRATQLYKKERTE